MAEYFKYITTYNNTLVDRSDTTFSPVPPYGEILSSYYIVPQQELYYYKESGGEIVLNDSATIKSYLEGTEPPPGPNDIVEQNEFTGYTESTDNNINYISGVTNTKLATAIFNTFTGTTLPTNYYNKTQINTYTGSTLTDINTRLLKTSFNTFSGTTLPTNYYNKTQINSYTGTTLTNINTRLLKTSFDTFSGTTLPTNYYNKTQINTYTGVTNTLIGTKINKVTGATSNLAIFSSDGNVVDSNVTISQLTGGTGYYVYGERETPGSTTSTTPITYLTTGATLTEGIFSLNYLGVIGNSVKIKPAFIQFYRDDSPISAVFAYSPPENNGVSPISFMRDTFLSGGTHTFSVRYYAGVNTALMNSAAIRVRKVQ